MDPKFAAFVLLVICGGLVGAFVGPLVGRWLDEMDKEKKCCGLSGTTPLPEEERAEAKAILEGFKRYNARGDLHDEEKGMSSQMYEAGWEDAKEYFTGKRPNG